jgi:hypothetical protein
MATKIQGGGSTSGIANVDSNFNLQVSTTLNELESGFVSITAENDAGTVTGTRATRAIEVSHDFRLRTANDQTIFNELFPGSAINTTIWTTPTTTATLTISGGFANLNAASSIAINAVARLQTYRSFPCYKSYTTYFEMELNFTSLPVVGNVCEWGAGISTGTTAPTDGAFFRLNAVGEFRAVINNNGVETQSGTLDFTTLVPINNTRAFLIYVCSNTAYFWIDNILVAKVEVPAGQGTVTSSQNLPLFFRNYNSTATSTAQVMKIAMVNVTLADQTSNKSWPHVLAGAGAHNSQGQTGGTLGSTALLTNSLVAGAGAAMTNTTAALGSGLGGQFTTQPTLAAGTDGIVSSYQVPLGTATYPGKSLYITRITINSAVSASLTGGPVLYAYSLAYGHTAVSLATTESATTKAPRRLPLGMQSFPVTSVAGTLATGNADFDLATPIVVQPGEFVQIVAKNLGTVTSAGTITFIISFGGYWE